MSGGVARHYAKPGLIGDIEAALRAAGKDPARLKPGDLAGIDEFHVRGREASRELAERLRLAAAMRVLDIGSGLGGAARMVALEYGCRVTGLDLTAAYCEAASVIAGWLGLEGRLDVVQGDALAMPFADAAFDAALTQHMAMNVADKPRLYAEVVRVLKPGGRFALYDVTQGPGGEALYPAPWARDAAISHLVTPAALGALLADVGLAVEGWRDVTRAGRDWFRAVAARLAEGGPPPVGFHLLLGAGFAEMADNQRRNLEEDRIALIEAIAVKSG